MDDIQKDMLNVWKSSWESYVKALSMMQEQGDKMLDLFFTQSETVQEETKKVLKQGIANAKEAQKAYLQAVEDNIRKIEELIEKK